MILLPVFGFSQLAGWNFNGVASPATLNATAVNPNLNQTVILTRGSGAPASVATSSFRTGGFGNNGIAVTNDDYFQFELKAATGFTMSLTSIDAQVKGTGTFAAAPGVSNQFAYSTDGTTFTLIGTPHIVTASNVALPTTNLSGIVALQNVPATTTVTFRFYASGQTTTGGWGFSSSTATTENLVIDGTTAAAVPCPTLVAPTATGTSICSNSSASLTATSAQTGSILKWYDVATGGSSLFTGSSFTTPVLTAATSYWVQDSVSGCPAGPRTEVIVTVSGVAPTVDAGPDQTICAGTSTSLTATGTGTFSWDNSVFQAMPFTPTVTTTYTVTVDNGVCTNTDQVTITVDQPSVAGTISASSLNACLNDVLTGTITGNTGTIQWLGQMPGSPAFFPVATGSTVTVPASQTGTYLVKAEVTNGVCPTVTSNVLTIVVNALPTVTAASNSPVCAGGTLNLTANTVAGATYGWTGPNSFTSAVQNPSIPSATALASGVYTLSITAGGCNAATGTVSVVVNALPTVNAGVDKSVCTGSSVTLAALGANTYTWSPATGLSSATGNTVTANPTATTTYTVTGTDANGCVGTDMVLVTVNPLPVVTIAANGLSLTASLSGATYKWINCADDMAIAGATSQTYVATANGSYKVEVTNSNGCVATSTCMNVTTVGVESKSDLNAFSISPNPTKGKVTITASGNESANVVIFNALGKEITRSNNVQNGTQLDLSAVQNGVYMVQISTDKGTKVLRIVKN